LIDSSHRNPVLLDAFLNSGLISNMLSLTTRTTTIIITGTTLGGFGAGC